MNFTALVSCKQGQSRFGAKLWSFRKHHYIASKTHHQSPSTGIVWRLSPMLWAKWEERWVQVTCCNRASEQTTSIVDTLPETNIAMENPPFWWYLPGKMGIFMGYVSFREGIPWSLLIDIALRCMHSTTTPRSSWYNLAHLCIPWRLHSQCSEQAEFKHVSPQGRCHW